MVTVSGFSMVTPASISSRRFALAQQAVHLGQLDAVVDAQGFARVVDAHGLPRDGRRASRISAISVR